MHELIQSGVLFPALGILILSGFLQGLAGFGLALLGVPLLTFYVLPQISVPLVTMLTIPVSGLMLIQLHRQIDWPRAMWMGIPTVLFAPFGVYLLKILSESKLCYGIGFLLLGSALYSFLKSRQAQQAAAASPTVVVSTTGEPQGLLPPLNEIASPATVPLNAVEGGAVRGKLVAIGCASGVLGGAIGMNGPLIADYLNKSKIKPDAFKVTLNLIFFVSAVTRVILYFAQGVMQPPSLWLALCGTPLAVAASYAGGLTTRRLRPESFAKAINAFLLLIGVWMLIQGYRKG